MNRFHAKKPSTKNHESKKTAPKKAQPHTLNGPDTAGAAPQPPGNSPEPEIVGRRQREARDTKHDAHD